MRPYDVQCAPKVPSVTLQYAQLALADWPEQRSTDKGRASDRRIPAPREIWEIMVEKKMVFRWSMKIPIMAPVWVHRPVRSENTHVRALSALIMNAKMVD